MRLLSKHIIIIGFKHVGKSCVGEDLAEELQVQFVDLDKQIEDIYELEFGRKCTCREIVNLKGEKYFRMLESSALSQVILLSPLVISLGGGTPMCEGNRNLIQHSVIIHIKANKHIVFQRIAKSGRPAFIQNDEILYESFSHLWEERTNVYEKHCDISVVNSGTVSDTVKKIIHSLPNEC
jgi:shikimate kinase